ncbi:MAG: hypothetical protein E7618_05340 [Ruminococcaceae bacterium]|nr:hypothetical protein [Oscillospiraceae bacterium]
MNQSPLYNTNINKHRRLKYGALAVALTAAVVALIVIVNAVFTALASKFLWFADMSREKLYTISQESIDLLDDYRETNEFHISIVFCSLEDQVKENYYSNLVLNLAKQYAEEFDFVSVEYVDIINHPEQVDKYLSTSLSRPKTTSVIITDGSESRIFTIDSFYTFDSETGDLFAFNGEYKITAAILQMCGDDPLAYFVTGHGEDIDGSVMWTLFEDAGFRVQKIDLSKETPDSTAMVMVINNPKYDYLGADDSVNEIGKIEYFLAEQGALMVFMDAGSGAMPELDEFLALWGISFEEMLIRDYDNSLSVDGTELVAEYTTEGTGASLTSTIRELQSIPKTIVNQAKPITLLYEEKTFGSSLRSTSVVLQTSSDKTASATPIDQDGEAQNGIFNLMTVTVNNRYIDNEAHRSYVLAAGTSSFAEDKYIGSRSYGNRDIIFNAMKNFGKETVPLDLDFKVFVDQGLDVTKGEANRLTLLCTVFLPVVVAAIGIVVYTRRRYL